MDLKNQNLKDNRNGKFNHFLKCYELERIVKLKGQLIPLSGKEARSHKSKVGFVTEDGRKFFVERSPDWDRVLWRHMWDYVNISGVLNLTQRSIAIRAFTPAGTDFSDFRDQPQEIDALPEYQVSDLMRQCGYLQPVA